MTTVVIRFSSLGDIVLTGAVTEALAPVTYVTHPRYHELAQQLPGVQHVVRHGLDPLPRSAARIVDLHASLRSRMVSLQIRGPVHRVQRHDLRRRSRVALKWGAPPPPVVERYARAAGVAPALTPWLPQASGDALIVCPTAAHATKQWPQQRYAALASRWQGPVVLLGGPGDAEPLQALARDIGSRATVIAERGFSQTLATLPRGRVAVGGDTGLMHLCAAAGIPTVVVFGPTTASDGFWIQPTEAPSVDLPCRPCSRHGGPRCPIGDHRCMTDLSIDQVWQALSRVATCTG
jgi:heptosyltransferase-2